MFSFVFTIMSFTHLEGEEKLKLAIMEFEDRSETFDQTMLSNAAEYLRSEFVGSDQFVVIAKERQEKTLIKEMKKESYQMCKDKNCQIPLGQALSADTILRTTINYFGGVYTITAELIDLAKEATVKGAKFQFDGSEQGLMKAMNRITVQLAKKAVSFKPETITSEEIKGVDLGGVELTTLPRVTVKKTEFKDVSSGKINKFDNESAISLDADADVLVAYDSALTADETGVKYPEFAKKKWKELSEMKGKNPFKQAALKRYNEWVLFTEGKEWASIFERAQFFEKYGKFFPHLAIDGWERLTLNKNNPYYQIANERIQSWKDFQSELAYFKTQKELFERQRTKDALNLSKLLPLKVLKPEQKRAMMVKYLELYSPYFGIDDIDLIFAQVGMNKQRELMELLYNEYLISEMDQKCQKGQGSACYIHASLTVVEKPDTALQYFEKACERGITDACVKAGKIYYDNSVEDKAYDLFSTSCGWESAEGCHITAFFTETGYHEKRNANIARELYKKACENGYKLSCKMEENITQYGYSSDQVKNIIEKKKFDKKISDAVGSEGDDLSKQVAKKANFTDTTVSYKTKEKYYPYKWAGISMVIVGAGILIGGTTGFAVASDSNYDKYTKWTTDEKILESITSGVSEEKYLDSVNKYKDKGDLYRTLSIVSGVAGGAIMITGIIIAVIPKEREVLKKVSFITDGKGFYAGIGFDF